MNFTKFFDWCVKNKLTDYEMGQVYWMWTKFNGQKVWVKDKV